MAVDQPLKKKKLKKLHIVNDEFIEKEIKKNNLKNIKLMTIAGFFVILSLIYLLK